MKILSSNTLVEITYISKDSFWHKSRAVQPLQVGDIVKIDDIRIATLLHGGKLFSGSVTIHKSMSNIEGYKIFLYGFNARIYLPTQAG